VDEGDSWNRRPAQGGKVADVQISAAGDLAVSITDHSFPCSSKVQTLMRGVQPFDLTWFGELPLASSLSESFS
jgi:hypothetical protein